MNKNGISAKIKSVDFEGAIITVSFEDGTPSQTITYQTNPEIDEVIEETKETKRIEEFPDVDEEGNDFVNKRVVTDTATIQVPTGKKIPNPNYRNPQSIADLEAICIENGFTK